MSDEMMMVSADTLAEMFRKSHVVDEATMKIVLPIFQAAVELAADAVKAEREACAKLIDPPKSEPVTPEARLARTVREMLAAAIRARGKT